MPARARGRDRPSRLREGLSRRWRTCAAAGSSSASGARTDSALPTVHVRPNGNQVELNFDAAEAQGVEPEITGEKLAAREKR